MVTTETILILEYKLIIGSPRNLDYILSNCVSKAYTLYVAVNSSMSFVIFDKKLASFENQSK